MYVCGYLVRFCLTGTLFPITLRETAESLFQKGPFLLPEWIIEKKCLHSCIKVLEHPGWLVGDRALPE